VKTEADGNLDARSVAGTLVSIASLGRWDSLEALNL
jgi:hypothetical protein